MAIVLDKWQKEVLETEGNICLCSGRQVGKSYVIAVKASEYSCKNRNKSVLIISSTERQAEELFIKILLYIEDNYKYLIKKGKERPTKRTLKLNNGSIIRCLPTGLTGSGIRGFTIDMLIEDESAYIPDEVMLAVTPMLLTTGGIHIKVSTPHGRLGHFYSAYNSGDYKVFHINSEEVITNRELSNSWTWGQRTAALGHLEREKHRMTALQYAQEYLGRFIEELRQFFKDDLITSCMTEKRREQIIAGDYYLGIDISRLGDDLTVLSIFQKTEADKLIQVESIMMQKIYLTEIVKETIRLENLYKFKQIYIDDGGIGVGVFDFLLDAKETKNKVIALNNRSRPLDADEAHKKKILKEDLYNNLLMLMERGDIKFLDDDEIFRSLKSIQYEYTLKPNALTKLRIFGNYSHHCESIMRAAWGLKDKSLKLWASYSNDGDNVF